MTLDNGEYPKFTFATEPICGYAVRKPGLLHICGKPAGHGGNHSQEEGPMLRIPTPHVPYGPKGVPAALADADYLDEAARHINGGYAVGGYNLTMTVVNLLHSVATELRAQHEKEQR